VKQIRKAWGVKTAEAKRKRKSGQCQVWKTWDKQTPKTANVEEKQISREAHFHYFYLQFTLQTKEQSAE